MSGVDEEDCAEEAPVMNARVEGELMNEFLENDKIFQYTVHSRICLFWESQKSIVALRRPEKDDGYVVEFHWAASCIVSGNTAFLKLGTAQDGKTAALYQVKYTTNNCCEPIELAPLLVRSHQLATKYGSVASDSGTKQRFAKNVLQKVLNKVYGLEEYSLEQAMVGNLNIPSCYCSDSVTYCFPWAAVKALKKYYRIDDESDVDSEDEDANMDYVVAEFFASVERYEVMEEIWANVVGENDNNGSDRIRKKLIYYVITRQRKNLRCLEHL